MKSRSEMTPEERATDNKIRRLRKLQGSADRDDVGLHQDGSLQYVIAPQTGYSLPAITSPAPIPSRIVAQPGKILDEQGNRKPRAEMSPEERAEDNRMRRMRKAAGLLAVQN